jgi:ribosome maturation factor RimP
MITRESVTQLIEQKIAETDMFIVDVTVRPGNVIDVTLDSDAGITIEACTGVQRHLLHEMDREVEDYSLEVSSPDLTKPLMVLRQYIKNIGRDLAVKKADKSKIEGQLIAANEQEITLLTQQKEEVPGKKGKKLVEREIIIPFTEMTEAKVMIRFK